MKTSATNKKIRELISMVKEDKIIPRPEFQRRLVWTRNDKDHFLDSILRGYPFPEIYLADGSVDLETGQGTQLLVDGLQRVSTMIQYFSGDPELKLLTVPNYKDLTKEEKESFLLYDVAVRDLGSISKDEIVEVFKRINATKYSLRDIEVNNARYSGRLKQFAENLSSDQFFLSHDTFTSVDYKRMGDLRYALGLVTTFIGGYSNRDDVFESYLDRFNDDLPDSEWLKIRFQKVFDFLEECGFEPSSRIWRKADLFTAIVELDQLINIQAIELQPSLILSRISAFYENINTSEVNPSSLPGIYYKAALQASNDRGNRLRRGIIFGGVAQAVDEAILLEQLRGPEEEESGVFELDAADDAGH